MFRRALSLLIVLTLSASAVPALARNVEKYQPISLSLITSYAVQTGLIPIRNDEQFLEYIRMSECDIYNMIKSSPFRQRELRTALEQKLSGTNQMNSKALLIYKDVTLTIADYNFDTQSIDITPDSQMRNVGTIQLIDERGEKTCGGAAFNVRESLPVTYNLKLVFPISLRRIPMQKDFAEALINRLDVSTRNKKYILHARLYFQVEPISFTNGSSSKDGQTALHGQLDMVDLFMDFERKTLIKRLDYAENY